jgi:Protein of unknown function (DUF2634).
MLPETQTLNVEAELTTEALPLKTYKLGKNGIEGYVDGVEAIEQVIAKIMQTERFQHLIYNWDYGIETFDLYGEDKDYVMADLKRRFEEALLQNTHILEIQKFECEKVGNDSIFVIFTCITTQGELNMERELNLNEFAITD